MDYYCGIDVSLEQSMFRWNSQVCASWTLKGRLYGR